MIGRQRPQGRSTRSVQPLGPALVTVADSHAAYIKHGVNHVLTKPVMLKDLKHWLNVAIQRRTAVVEVDPDVSLTTEELSTPLPTP